MGRLMNALAKVPSWMRWIVFLPLGVWAGLRVEQAFDAIVGLTASDRAANALGGDIRIYASQFASTIALVALPAVLSPRPRDVARVMFVVWSLLAVPPVAYRIWIGYVVTQIIVGALALGAQVLGGAVGVVLVARLVAQHIGSGSSRDGASLAGAPQRAAER